MPRLKKAEVVVASPCVSDCRAPKGICLGCGRTLEEIAHWGSMTNLEKSEIRVRLGWSRKERA